MCVCRQQKVGNATNMHGHDELKHLLHMKKLFFSSEISISKQNSSVTTN